MLRQACRGGTQRKILFAASKNRSLEAAGTLRGVRREFSSFSKSADDAVVCRIGHVERPLGRPVYPQLVPIGYLPQTLHFFHGQQETLNTVPLQEQQLSPSELRHLQWLMSKDNLAQDALLVGPPSGSGYRRRLALKYCEMLGREYEIVSLTADITESDLKQRRELVRSARGASIVEFVDQAAVRAAVHGRVLILDGLERAERNVLPTLNNLLENREMHLEDGRLLVSSKRYQELKHHSAATGDIDGSGATVLFPTHDDFRVIALATPVPPYRGRTLDPPLRSRFQIRRVDNPLPQDMYESIIVQQQHDKEEHRPSVSELSKRFSSLAGAMDAAAQQHHPVIPTFPFSSLPSVVKVMHSFHLEDERAVLARVYPYGRPTRQQSGEKRGEDGVGGKMTEVHKRAWKAFNLACDRLQIGSSQLQQSPYVLQDIARVEDEAPMNGESGLKADVTFVPSVMSSSWSKEAPVTVRVPCGPGLVPSSLDTAATSFTLVEDDDLFVMTPTSQSLLTTMFQTHYSDRDILLLSPQKGMGKTALAQKFASLLGYDTHTFPLYGDMSPRDLLMRRSTNEVGDTIWEPSPLVQAAKTGGICILDGIEKLQGDALVSLQSLMEDREFDLPNGQRMLREDRYRQIASSEVGGTMNGVIPIRDSFRVIALGTSSSSSAKVGGVSSFLADEVMNMFSTIQMDPPDDDCLWEILHRRMIGSGKEEKLFPRQLAESVLDKIIDFHRLLTPERAADCGVAPLSVRNLVRIVKQARAQIMANAAAAASDGGDLSEEDVDLHAQISAVLMAELLPSARRATLNSLFRQAGVLSHNKDTEDGIDVSKAPAPLETNLTPEHLTIGSIKIPRYNTPNVPRKGNDNDYPHRPEMVPSPEFFDIPSHLRTLHDLIYEYSQVGERAFLLLGNQGVGKNKIADRLFHLLNMEREYIQLHRDSTVGQLTLTPSLSDDNGSEGGGGTRIVWEDSPLVRAVTRGCALVVDEADKAPLEVVTVLKGLVEDGEMLLADGRRIVRRSVGGGEESDDIHIHPDFSIWVLANRPGFPFLGNDFFREIGDCFSAHAIPNPDLHSEELLLQSYAPTVSRAIIRKIAMAFADLRKLSDSGDIAYPYSAREAVAVARHLERYQNDGLASTLRNVLDMDTFDERVYERLVEVFARQGIPLIGGVGDESVRLQIALAHPKEIPQAQLSETWTLGEAKDHVHHISAEFIQLNPRQWDLSKPVSSTFAPDEERIYKFSELVRSWSATSTNSTRGSGNGESHYDDGDATSLATNTKNGSVHVLTSSPVLLQSYYNVLPLDGAGDRAGADEPASEPSGPPTWTSLDIESKLPYFVPVFPKPIMIGLEETANKPFSVLVFFPGSTGDARMLFEIDPGSGNVTYMALPISSDDGDSDGVSFGQFFASAKQRRRQGEKEWRMIPRRSNELGGGSGAIMYQKGGHLMFLVTADGLSYGAQKICLPNRLTSIESLTLAEHQTFMLRLNDSEQSLWIGKFEDETSHGGNGSFLLHKVIPDSVNNETSRPACQASSLFIGNRTMLSDDAFFHMVDGIGHDKMKVYSSYRNEKTDKVLGGLETIVPTKVTPKKLSMEAGSTSSSNRTIVAGRKNTRRGGRVALEVLKPAKQKNELLTIKTEARNLQGIANLTNLHVVTLESNGRVRLFQIDGNSDDLRIWREMFGLPVDGVVPGGEGNTLSLEYIRNEGGKDGTSAQPPDLGSPKRGKWDEDNAPHVGGNQWAGGTGGSDTAGLGGRGGPYRLDRGHKVHQVSDEAKAAVSKEAAAAAREIAQKALEEKLNEIDMVEAEWKMYESLVEPIRVDIANLRATLSLVESKQMERGWIKRQTYGEIDDSKLVDGVTGEKLIYKRRGNKAPEPGAVMKQPKRLQFVMDCSGSMYRFNGQDERLNRSLEAAALIMESFDGMKDRFDYSIVGHSGDSSRIEFVDFGKPPKDAKERMKVLQKMVAHTQFCQSGDNTLSAMKRATVDVLGNNGRGTDCDECIVVGISDANLSRYGIRPDELRNVMESGEENVKAYCIFIASLGSEADDLKKALPVGRGFVCMQTKELPRVVRSILAGQIE